ncbi:hypothetical protein NDU88_002074 [Pleurodeles waltl]|uniref:Uncharacterized protein n=1 Tax=Pleurodeles waltl TaxID=8319 RepID=A0AAV7VYB2_PLEWA|nr:hypothetical protein NDU88_002074 [Pleurodeles waltl]
MQGRGRATVARGPKEWGRRCGRPGERQEESGTNNLWPYLALGVHGDGGPHTGTWEQACRRWQSMGPESAVTSHANGEKHGLGGAPTMEDLELPQELYDAQYGNRGVGDGEVPGTNEEREGLDAEAVGEPDYLGE